MNRTVTNVIILAICIVGLLAGIAAFFIFDTNFKEQIVVEVGDSVSLHDFFEKNVPEDATSVTDLETVSEWGIGSYPVEISFDGRTRTSTLILRDTVSPVVKVKNELVAWVGVGLQVEDCLEEVSDMTETRVYWLTAPPDEAGKQSGVIQAIDRGGNVTNAEVKVTVINDSTPPEIKGVRDIKAYVNDEMDLFGGITVVDNKDPSPKLTASPDLSDCYVAGDYTLKYTATDASGNISEAVCTLTLELDTELPSVICSDIYNVTLGSSIDLGALPTVSDNSQAPLDVIIEGTVDFTTEGSYPVVYKISDRTGNTVRAESTVNVAKDVTPPTIGVAPIQIFLGDSVSYKKHTPIYDDFVGDIKLDIDSSRVDLNKIGEYTVVFTATDASGNVAVAEAPVSVIERPSVEAETHQMIDDLLAEIITKDMTDLEKLWAMYKWINTNIGYVSTSDKSNYVKGAYDGLKSRLGDCYTYYSLVRIMAEHMGFEHREVVRDSLTTEHYWNLIYYNGGWYHLDTSRFIKGNARIFMLTDEEAAEWDAINYRIGHVFDHSLHPPRATESVQQYVDYDSMTLIGQ